MAKKNRILTDQESEAIRATVALCDKSPSGLAWREEKKRELNPTIKSWQFD